MNLEDFIKLDLLNKELIFTHNPFTQKELNRPKRLGLFDFHSQKDDRSEVHRLYHEKVIPLSKELAEAKREIRELKSLSIRKRHSEALQRSEKKRLKQLKDVLDNDREPTS